MSTVRPCVTGLGVAELKVSGRVVGWYSDGSGVTGEGYRPVRVDGVDGPSVSVLDHVSPVGPEGSVVAAGHYLISNTDHFFAKPCGSGPDGDFAVEDPGLLSEPVEPTHGFVRVRHESHGLTPRSCLSPSFDDLGLHFLGGPSV